MNTLIEATRAIIFAAALGHGVDPRIMDRIANCESGYNRYAVGGQYVGLYQLGAGKQQQFRAEGFTDLYDPAQQANFVAERLADGEQSAWIGCLR